MGLYSNVQHILEYLKEILANTIRTLLEKMTSDIY